MASSGLSSEILTLPHGFKPLFLLMTTSIPQLHTAKTSTSWETLTHYQFHLPSWDAAFVSSGQQLLFSDPDEILLKDFTTVMLVSWWSYLIFQLHITSSNYPSKENVPFQGSALQMIIADSPATTGQNSECLSSNTPQECPGWNVWQTNPSEAYFHCFHVSQPSLFSGSHFP